MPNQEKAFLGTGWAFPPRLNADGKIALATYEEDIDQALRIILGTNPGERIMRPDFGAGLETFVFELLNTTTMYLIKTSVEEALIDWEPRIDVEKVSVSTDPGERHKLYLDVTYRVRATNALHNLVYPFYLQEGTPT